MIKLSELPEGAKFKIDGDNDNEFIKLRTFRLKGWNGPLLFNAIVENEFFVECIYVEEDTEVTCPVECSGSQFLTQ